MTFRLHLDQAAIDGLLNDPAGPVGLLLGELATRGAAIARATAPVRRIPGTRRTRAGRNSSARPPGFTRASVHPHGPVRGSYSLYASVNAAADPTIYLEYPAEQMSRKYPFLTTALDSLEGQVF